MDKDAQIAALTKALTTVIQNHCANEKLFCGSCTEARRLLAELGSPIPPRAPDSLLSVNDVLVAEVKGFTLDDLEQATRPPE